MGKIRMKKAKNEVLTLREVFREFVNSQEAKGVAAQTVKTYHTHFQSVSKHLNMDLTFAELSKRDLENMIVSMRAAGLANNSISSYHSTEEGEMIGIFRYLKIVLCGGAW